jgi:hypothetical protein
MRLNRLCRDFEDGWIQDTTALDQAAAPCTRFDALAIVRCVVGSVTSSKSYLVSMTRHVSTLRKIKINIQKKNEIKRFITRKSAWGKMADFNLDDILESTFQHKGGGLFKIVEIMTVI